MKYAYLLAKVYRCFEEAEVKFSGFDCQLYCKMSLLLLNAEAHAWKLKTAHSEKSAGNSSSFPGMQRCMD